MRIFLIGWNNTKREFYDVALELQKRGHKVLYWVGGDNEKSIEISKLKLNQTIFHRHSDAVSGIRPREFKGIEFAPPGEDFIKQFYETESVLLTMKLFEKMRKVALEKKHFFHSMLQYWHGVIKKLKPDVIIFALWPHSGYNFLVYSLAKKLGIKTIMFEYARIADRLLLINDIKIGSLYLKKEIKRNKDKNFKLEDLSPDIKKYYNEQVEKGVYTIPPDVKALSNRYSGINLLLLKLKMIVVSILDFSIFKKTYNYIIKQFKSNLKKEYTSLQKKPDLSKKYIYVALHYQPECTTSPLGGVFVDQVLMVKILSAAVPKDWVIYVKEHPYQWLPYGLSYFNYRYEGYYKSIAKLKNVQLIPLKTNPVELINRAQAVASVTGTTCWEAVLRLKPALVFGYAWYRDCPGVFRVNSVDSCQKAIEKILSGYKINRQRIINYLASLDKISIHGYFEKITKEQSSLTEAECTAHMLKALVQEIEGK